jgi:hypothetical protein
MVSWECPTKPREASGLDPEAVHETGGWEDLTAWRTTRQNLAVAQAALAFDEASHQLTV